MMFETYLEEVCFEEYPEVLDDDRPDFFDTWLTELSVADYLRHGNDCGDKVLIVERERLIQAIKEIPYNTQAEGCGLEDKGITDRYEAMEYGWIRAMKRVDEAIE